MSLTYGMGVYWAKEAAKNFEGRVEIIDLRTIKPIDETLVFERLNYTKMYSFNGRSSQTTP